MALRPGLFVLNHDGKLAPDWLPQLALPSYAEQQCSQIAFWHVHYSEQSMARGTATDMDHLVPGAMPCFCLDPSCLERLVAMSQSN